MHEACTRDDGCDTTLANEQCTPDHTTAGSANLPPDYPHQHSGEFLVRPPRPGPFTADASAGLPTVSGQRKANSIAAGPEPVEEIAPNDISPGAVQVSITASHAWNRSCGIALASDDPRNLSVQITGEYIGLRLHKGRA